jgi:hypothetical protein
MFFYDSSQVLRFFEIRLWWYCGYTLRGMCLDISVYHELAQMLEIALHERQLQLYYEGLILTDRYGEAFQRNLVSEKDEQDRRS